MNIDLLALTTLTKHFHDISNEQLLHRCSSGSLTEDAQSIAYAELASRGLNLPNADSAQDECAPYEGDFETVAQLLNSIDAYVIAGSLKAAGIPAVVADTNPVQTNSRLAIAVGGAHPCSSCSHRRG